MWKLLQIIVLHKFSMISDKLNSRQIQPHAIVITCIQWVYPSFQLCVIILRDRTNHGWNYNSIFIIIIKGCWSCPVYTKLFYLYNNTVGLLCYTVFLVTVILRESMMMHGHGHKHHGSARPTLPSISKQQYSHYHPANSVFDANILQ